jgi:GH25 family lysozyme M1 (1,4-beta-N-acetylmuramidase)
MTNRDEYVAKLKKQLDDWNEDMARWEAKAKSAQAGMKERYKRELDVLNAQRELARYNLRLLEDASASAWTEMRKGADEAWDRMRAAAAAAGTYFEKSGDKKP